MLRKKIREFLGDFSMAGLRRYDAPGNLRWGQEVIGSHGGVLSDEQTEDLPTTSIVMLQNKVGKFLAVSRGKDLSDMNLPGGGIELGENAEDAARRELWEETGLIAHELVQIYSGNNDLGNNVVVFKALSASGKLKSSEEGETRWVSKEELLSGSYGDFFSKILKKVTL